MSGMNCKLKRLVRLLSAWAWADEIETTKRSGGVLRWKSEYDWWHWYVVEVGTEGGHEVIGHANQIVRKAWDAARERMPNADAHIFERSENNVQQIVGRFL